MNTFFKNIVDRHYNTDQVVKPRLKGIYEEGLPYLNTPAIDGVPENQHKSQTENAGNNESLWSNDATKGNSNSSDFPTNQFHPANDANFQSRSHSFQSKSLGREPNQEESPDKDFPNQRLKKTGSNPSDIPPVKPHIIEHKNKAKGLNQVKSEKDIDEFSSENYWSKDSEYPNNNKEAGQKGFNFNKLIASIKKMKGIRKGNQGATNQANTSQEFKPGLPDAGKMNRPGLSWEENLNKESPKEQLTGFTLKNQNKGLKSNEHPGNLNAAPLEITKINKHLNSETAIPFSKDNNFNEPSSWAGNVGLTSKYGNNYRVKASENDNLKEPHQKISVNIGNITIKMVKPEKPMVQQTKKEFQPRISLTDYLNNHKTRG